MIVRTPYRSLCAAATAWCYLAGWGTATGAEPAAASSEVSAGGHQELETITITARKQSENLQSVPMSITVMEQRELERRGAFDVGDIIASVPNVSFSYGTGDGRNNSRQIALRGVYGAGNIGGSGTTGFYLDETPLDLSAPVKLVDANNVEVLRGPQGTLYGARSMGGTVKIVTNKPNFAATSFDFKSSVDHVDNGGFSYGVQGTINVPLANAAALRATAYYDRLSGFFDRVYGGSYAFPAGAPSFTSVQGQGTTGVARDVDLSRAYGLQLAIAWAPTDRLTLTPKAIYQRNSADGASLADTTPNNRIQRRAFNIEEPAADRIWLTSLDVDYAAPWGSVFSSTSHYERRNSESEDSSEEIAAPAAFGLIAGSVEQPFPSPISRTASSKVDTEELRVLPHRFNEFDFIGGIFLQRTVSDVGYDQNAPGLGNYLGSLFGIPNPLPTDYLFFSSTETKVREQAVFGELTYHATDQLSGLLGARIYHVDTDFHRISGGLIVNGSPIPDPVIIDHNSASGVTPKLELQYDFSPHSMVYASAAKGFRIGGNNAVLPTSCAADLAAIGRSSGSARKYDSDSLWSYETGFKLESLPQRLTLNGAVYYIDWSDILQNILLPCGFNFLTNAGKARSIGGELEATIRPTRGLTWNLGAGYTDATLTEVSPGVSAHVGDRIQQVPRLTGNTSLQYTQPFGAGLQGLYRIDFSYVGKSFTTFDQSDALHTRHAYRITDLRLGLVSGSWEAGMFLRNAFNTHANLGDDKALALELAGRPRLTTTRPRTIGLDITAHF